MSGALILTAKLPPDLHAWATRLRDAHFPPERNYLEAHVTLFHALPPSCEGEVCTHLKQLAGEFAAPQARLTVIMSLGGGTALKVESDAVLRIRSLIAERFHGALSAQDQGGKRLHITVQNKVSSKEAKALQAKLSECVEERPFAFPGLALFRYLGGPWEEIRSFAFRGKAQA